MTAGTATLPVANPATGEVFDHAATCPPDALDRIVHEARDRYREWSRRTLAQRAELLSACTDALSARVEELAALLTAEQGKPLSAARAEVRLAADWFRHTAALTLDPQTLVDEPGTRVVLERVPRGVVAAIAPSNYPLILAVTKVAPALLAGNTVVLKPSPLTPLSTLRLVEVLSTVLPAGAVTAVVGGADLGRALVDHPDVAVVSFTGSVDVGRRIAAAAAGRLAHAVLELGGNDPCVILPGTDIAAVADQIFWLAMRNSGQFCAAVKRVYVPREGYRELIDAFAAAADRAVVGDGADPATELGPLAAPGYANRVARLVDDACAAGARVYAGGKPLDRPGWFYPPTVVADLPPGTALERTEQFGPAIPVVAYTDLADAVARANATEYGLGASVWGDPAAARAVAAELDCGTVWLNTHGDLRHDVPFGGTRHSGLGVEYGYWGLLEYTHIKVAATKEAGGAAV